MTDKQATHLPIPGANVVGRGVYLKPRQPYILKDFLFQPTGQATYFSKETQQTYALAEGYAVNDSPPMPANQMLNQTMIEESWERFDKQMSLDTSAAVSGGVFSIDATASQANQAKSNEEAYYALRSSFIPLWTVYLPNTSRLMADQSFEVEIPTPFSHQHRAAYERFFERYGTHYVKRVWVGGKAMLTFTIAKKSQMSKDEIQAGLKASYTIQKGEANIEAQQSKEKLQNNSECSVFGKGGDEFRLAALSSLDEVNYNKWLETIKENPQVIELEVAGIWTLLENQAQAQALQDAYKEATIFTPISAIFSLGTQIYFIRGNQFFQYDVETHTSKKPQPLLNRWPSLAQVGFDWPDAAFVGYDLPALKAGETTKKLFFFNHDQYIRIDAATHEIDAGYPKPVEAGWPGVTFDRIDAILSTDPKTVYFFQGNEYIRYDQQRNQIDEGYPALLTQGWFGVTFDRIDAAIYWGNSKVYFFREDQHIRYDMVIYQADPGFPKYILGNYVEDWKFFN